MILRSNEILYAVQTLLIRFLVKSRYDLKKRLSKLVKKCRSYLCTKKRTIFLVRIFARISEPSKSKIRTVRIFARRIEPKLGYIEPFCVLYSISMGIFHVRPGMSTHVRCCWYMFITWVIFVILMKNLSLLFAYNYTWTFSCCLLIYMCSRVCFHCCSIFYTWKSIVRHF